MYKRIIILVLIIILSGCEGKKTEQPELNFNSAEEHIKFIIEDYSFGEYGSYIPDFVVNEFATNEFIIDSLADNYSKVLEICLIDNDMYRIKTDNGELLDIYLKLSGNKIEKIKVKAGKANDKEEQ